MLLRLVKQIYLIVIKNIEIFNFEHEINFFLKKIYNKLKIYQLNLI